jgi:ABC-2 type transport system permease protein
MRNIWVIFRKELNSYFVSPVAYLLLAMFAIIFGFFFWNSLGYFVYMGIQSQMRGQSFPMNVNEELIRPLLANISVVGLFLIPMITMRLFAEEKRTGTIELLATSPIRDIEVILGKWLAAVALYSVMLLLTALNFAFIFKYGHPDWKPVAAGWGIAGDRHLYLHADQEPDYRGCHDVWGLPAPLDPGMGRRIRNFNVGQVPFLHVGDHPL